MILKNKDASIEYVITRKKDQLDVFFRYKGYGLNFIETSDSLPSYLDFSADILGVYLGISTMDRKNMISLYYNGFVYFKLHALSIAEKVVAKANYRVKRIRLDKIFSLLGIREMSLILNTMEIQDDGVMVPSSFSEYKQFLVEVLHSSIRAFPLHQDALALLFDHAIDYGVASGMDVFFETNTDQGLAVFRLKEQDYISAKNFKIWAMASCGWKVVISDDEWTDFVKFVIEKATKQIDDPISPPVISTLCDRLKLGNIYGDETEDFINSITSGGAMAIALLQENVLIVPASLLQDVVARIKVTTMRKARQIIMPFIVDNADKSTVMNFHFKVDNADRQKSVRVWRFDWIKLLEVAPDLAEKQLLTEGGN